jgi:hypothetical protein
MKLFQWLGSARKGKHSRSTTQQGSFSWLAQHALYAEDAGLVLSSELLTERPPQLASITS